MSNLDDHTYAHLLRTADQRRRTATKLADTYGFSADYAASVARLAVYTVSNPDRELWLGPNTADLTMPSWQAATTPVLADVNPDVVATSLVGWWPLIEPNLVATGRIGTLAPPLPTFDALDPDGAAHITWATPDHHSEALLIVTDDYTKNHYLARTDMRRDALYGMLDPILAIPVRHHYQDGSPAQFSFMAADGTGRLLAARLHLARLLLDDADRLDHPYMHPDTLWPQDTVTLKKMLAAHPPMPLHHTVNVVHPHPSNWLLTVSAWNFRHHTSG